MSADFFVDTKILVYCRDESVLEKQAQASVWIDYLWSKGSGRLSTQVLAEYYVVVTNKLKPGMEIKSAREDVEDLFAWQPLPVTAELINRAWITQDLFHLSWWDALIISAAKILSCAYLLSEDFQHDQDFQGLRVINPFRKNPPDI